MADCLVTQLKSTVNNIDLPVFGYASLIVEAEDGQDYLNLFSNVRYPCKLIGNAYFVDSNGVNKGKEIANNTEWHHVHSVNGDFKFLIPDGTIIATGSNNFNTWKPLRIDLSFFKRLNFSIGISTLNLNGGDIAGTLEDITNLPITNLTIGGTVNATGTVNDINVTTLTQLSLNMPGISGEFTDLLDRVAAAVGSEGSRTVLFLLYNTNITYFGEPNSSIQKQVRFGTAMVNPSAQDTERNWQIV